MKQKKWSPKIPLRSFCVSHLLQGIRSTLKCGLYTQLYSIGKEILFPLQVVDNCMYLLGQDENSCPLFTFSAGTPSVLDLCRPCVCCQSQSPSGFICVSVLLCLGDTISLVSYIPSVSYSLSTSSSLQLPEPRGDGFDEAIPFKTECLNVLRPLTLCRMSSHGSLYWFLFAAGGKFSNGDSVRKWSMGITQCH